MDAALRPIGQQLSCRSRPASINTDVGNYALPFDYVEFIHEFNDARGPICNTEFVSLWPIGELAETNRGYST